VTTDPPVDAVRSVIAVLGAIVVAQVLPELLETVLVRAAADGPLPDVTAYFTVRNQPRILVAKVVSTIFTSILAGYFAGRLAGSLELGHAGIAGILQTATLAWGFTMGEYAAATPPVVRIAIVAITAPAMVVGAWIRRRARLSELVAAGAGNSS
jgi:hypothetical protein